MKKIQRLTFLLLLFLCLGQIQGLAQDPIIICPADITISCNEDHLDTDITGIATASGISGPEEVEYNDIIVNLNETNEGFTRRRWNVVGRSDIFCDQTISSSCYDGILDCTENLVSTITSGSTNVFQTKVFAQSLINAPDGATEIKVSRDGVYFHDFITFDCCDIGYQTFYASIVDENGDTHKCENQILIQYNLPPAYIGPNNIHLALYDESSVELTVDMLEPYFIGCPTTQAVFSQSIFTSVGEYPIDYTLTNGSGNSFSGSLTVSVSSGNTIACNQQINTSLDNTGQAIITPDLLAEGYPPINGEYKVSIDEGPFVDQIILDCNDVGPHQFTLQNKIGNVCWGTLNIEDKLAPVINIQEEIQLSITGQNEVELTSEMLDPYTFDNCGIATYDLSQSIFTSIGTYFVTYTVTDYAGLTASQVLEIKVKQGGATLACNNLINIDLNEEGFVTFDANAQLEGSIYLNYNFAIGVGPHHDEITEYFDEITLDCSYLGLNTVEVRDPESGNSCWGQVNINDVHPPTPIAHNSINVTLEENEPYVLNPALINAGSFDNCTSAQNLAMSVTPNTFTTPGEYEVKLRVFDESGNSDVVTSTVFVQQEGTQSLECVSLSSILTNPFGPTTVFAINFVLNPEDFETISMSTDINGVYSQTFNFDCSEFPINEAFPIYIKGETGGQSSICSVLITLIDNVPPIAVVNPYITLQLVNGQATLTTAEVDDGSYDLCGNISLSLSQTIFTAADLGSNFVTLTVIDNSGNINSAFVEVLVIGDSNDNPCSLEYLIFPEDISISDENGTYENLSVENLQTIYNYNFEDVHPYTIVPCDDLSYSYEDQVLFSEGQIKVLRTFSAIDWSTTNIRTETQIINLLLNENTALVCITGLSVNVNNGSVLLLPETVLLGNYNFSNIGLTITFNGDTVLNNVITPNYAGQTLIYEVVDFLTGNSCTGTIEVINDQDECPIDIDTDVSFPLESIFLTNANISASVYTPENLIADYGFAEEDVMVIIDSDCSIAAFVFEDQVFQLTDDNYKIIRTFTIIDWVTYNPMSAEGVYTFEQTINVGIDPNSFICDVLPNSAPVGDCDTGHTLEDDVEWPSDLQVSDYNITPEDLIVISEVPEQDAMPIFYNTPDDYTATYIDLLTDLTPTTLTIDRVWKAVNNTYDISWNYSQKIEVDISEFQNLISVNTSTNRVVPGVIINDSYMTNEDGEVQVPEEIVSIHFEDEVKNGLDIIDLILIQRHILAIDTLKEGLIHAADANNDNKITATDIVEIKNRMIGVSNEVEWKFIENSFDPDQILHPKAEYTAYKVGDIDDSALLPGEELIPTSVISVNDQVLNIGETYMVPISIATENPSLGIDIRMKLNLDLIDENSINIINTLPFESETVDISQEGDLYATLFNSLETINFNDSEIIFIEFTAKANTLLGYAISLDEEFSFSATEDLNIEVLGGKIENVITGSNDIELASVNVYPNPTSDYLVVDINDIKVKGDLTVNVINGQGQILINQSSNMVDVQSLSPGVYYYDIKIGTYEKKGKFLVIR